MKKIIVILMAMILSMSAFSGCASCVSQPAAPTVPGSVETTTPVEIETDKATEPMTTGEDDIPETTNGTYTNPSEKDEVYPLVPVTFFPSGFEANGLILEESRDLEDPFDAYNNEAVEKIQYTDFSNLLDILEETPYGKNQKKRTGELRLYQSAENVHVGWLDDVLVGDFTFKGDDFVWHFRAETVDQMENRSGIVIPNLEHINHAEFPSGEFISAADYYWFNWFAEYEEGTPLTEARQIDITIVFFPNTHHQYTFYSQEVRTNAEGKDNFQTLPGRVVQNLQQTREDYGY